VRKLIMAASLSCSLLFVGCAAKPQAKNSTPTATASVAPTDANARAQSSTPSIDTTAPADPKNKVIVHIVSQHQTITVTSGPTGLLYSLKDPNGHVQIADATPAKFAELQPQLYQQIQSYIAVHADDAPITSAGSDVPIPTASVDSGIPTADRHQKSFAPSMKSPVSSDQFNRTAERPFPTAREDAPE